MVYQDLGKWSRLAFAGRRSETGVSEINVNKKSVSKKTGDVMEKVEIMCGITWPAIEINAKHLSGANSSTFPTASFNSPSTSTTRDLSQPHNL